MTEQEKVQNPILPSFTEAPASINFFGITSKGWNVQITLRDDSEDHLLQRFAAFVKELEDVYKVTPKAVGSQASSATPAATTPAVAPQPANPLAVAAAPSTPPPAYNPDWCPIHGVTMKQHEKDGKTWFSHKAPDDSWCRGKAK